MQLDKLDHKYYATYLPGITEDMPEPFWKLAQLLSQNQFEWLADGRVVFLMNDAVESFLVFTHFKMTGELDPVYDGDIEAYVDRKDDEYFLIVHQGRTNVVTILFHELEYEIHLYNYGEIGHFWMKNQEDLRQLEYRLAILYDKVYYMDEECASEEERHLAKLYDFPPIMNWHAVPAKYATPKEHPWTVTAEAIEVMRELAVEAGDKILIRALRIYQMHPSEFVGKRIAHLLTKPSSNRVLVLLAKKLKKAASIYENRSFGKELDCAYQAQWEKGQQRKKELQEQGISATVLREEPFVDSPDDITYKVYVMYAKKQGSRKLLEIELIE